VAQVVQGDVESSNRTQRNGCRMG